VPSDMIILSVSRRSWPGRPCHVAWESSLCSGNIQNRARSALRAGASSVERETHIFRQVVFNLRPRFRVVAQVDEHERRQRARRFHVCLRHCVTWFSLIHNSLLSIIVPSMTGTPTLVSFRISVAGKRPAGLHSGGAAVVVAQVTEHPLRVPTVGRPQGSPPRSPAAPRAAVRPP